MQQAPERIAFMVMGIMSWDKKLSNKYKRKTEAKAERLFREDVERDAENGTKAKKQAEPVVTLLKKHKHTQVNYYPYKSLTTARTHTALT